MKYFAAVLLVVLITLFSIVFGFFVGFEISSYTYEEYSDFPAGPFFGLFVGGGIGLIAGIWITKPLWSNKKVDHSSLIEMPPAEPYIYRETLANPSLFPPRRVRDFDANGLSTVGSDEVFDAWIIFYPSQPTDKDAHFLFWDKRKVQWLWRAIGYGPYAPINDKIDEKMAGVLLEYFDLLEIAGEYPPQRLQILSPERLLQASQSRSRIQST